MRSGVVVGGGEREKGMLSAVKRTDTRTHTKVRKTPEMRISPAAKRNDEGLRPSQATNDQRKREDQREKWVKLNRETKASECAVQ